MKKSKNDSMRFVLIVDLADSTSYKYKHENNEKKWVSRQYDFLEQVSSAFYSHMGGDSARKKEIFYKYMGDAVLFSIATNHEKILVMVDDCIHRIHDLSKDHDPCNFHIAMDYGKVSLLDDDPIGHCVDRCSRILSLAGKNQVLVSDSAYSHLYSVAKIKNNKFKKIENVILSGISETQIVYEYKYDDSERRFKSKKEIPDILWRKTEIIHRDHYNDSRFKNYHSKLNDISTVNEYTLLEKDKIKSGHKLKLAAIGPHIDDIELGCGGTLAKLIDLYDVELYYYVLSHDKLEWDGKSLEKRVNRLQDAKKSFKYLMTGNDNLTKDEIYETVIKKSKGKRLKKKSFSTEFDLYEELDGKKFLGKFKAYSFHDAKMESQVEELRNLFRKLQTTELSDVDIIFVPSFKDIHQDHKTIANISMQIFRKHETLFFYKTPDSGKHPMERFNPNLYIDVSDATKPNSIYMKLKKSNIDIPSYADIKLHLMNYFESESDKHWYDEFSFLSEMSENAKDAYMPIAVNKKKYSEGFECVLRL